jgi:hypothetical protein
MKNIFTFLFLAGIICIAVLFGTPKRAFASDLPLAKGELGSGCAKQDDCSTRLFCANSICSQCENDSNCKTGDSCKYGVCQTLSGNEASGLCTRDANCTEGLICGTDKKCQFAEESAGPSVSPSTPPSTSPSTPAGNTGLGNDDWTGRDITIQDVEGIVIGIACWMMRGSADLMIIFLVWSGILFMYAQGDPTKYKKAKDTLQKTLWGMLIILGVYVIIATVANAVGLQNFSFIPLAC